MMTSAADILPGHRGTCHRAPGFSDPDYERVAARIEEDYQGRFLQHGAILRVVPLTIRFSSKKGSALGRSSRRSRWLSRNERYVGEGVAIRIDPATGRSPRQWLWWAEAEADMIVRQRKESEQDWTVVYPPEEVENLLRTQAETYLRQFALSEQHPDAPYAEHDGTRS